MQGQNQVKAAINNPQGALDQAKEKVEKGIKGLEKRFDSPEASQDMKALKADIGLLDLGRK
jgi:hypothetical protein